MSIGRQTQTYIKDSPSSKILRFLNRHDRQLQHHGEEAVTAEFLGNAAHDQFVGEGADEEGRKHGHELG